MTDKFSGLQLLESFSEDNPDLPKKQLLWLRYRSMKPIRRIDKETGQVRLLKPLPYADAFRKIGGKIYILPKVFFDIVDRENGHPVDAA